MYTLDVGRILIESIISMCGLNLMAWKASWALRTSENAKTKIKKDHDKKVGPNVERLCSDQVRQKPAYSDTKTS